MGLRSMSLIFSRIPLLAMFFRIYAGIYSHIWPNMGIWAYMAIREKTWPNWVSLKRASKMKFRDIDLRHVGHSIQKQKYPTLVRRCCGSFWELMGISVNQC